MKRHCRFCNDSFECNNNNKNTLCDRCKRLKDYFRENNKNKAIKSRFFKFCKNEDCQKRFKPKGRYQVYCDDCINESNRARLLKRTKAKNLQAHL